MPIRRRRGEIVEPNPSRENKENLTPTKWEEELDEWELQDKLNDNLKSITDGNYIGSCWIFAEELDDDELDALDDLEDEEE